MVLAIVRFLKNIYRLSHSADYGVSHSIKSTLFESCFWGFCVDFDSQSVDFILYKDSHSVDFIL